MSSGWSIFVVVLTIANILGCFWLLRWTAKPKHAGEKIGGGSDTGAVRTMTVLVGSVVVVIKRVSAREDLPGEIYMGGINARVVITNLTK